MTFDCDMCSRTYMDKRNLLKHVYNGNDGEAEAKVLSELKMESKLIVNSEDEPGVVSEKEKRLMAQKDSIKDEDGKRGYVSSPILSCRKKTVFCFQIVK